MIEIPDHPYFLACQCHPELKSKPFAPHPLFVSFVKAALVHQEARVAADTAAGIATQDTPGDTVAVATEGGNVAAKNPAIATAEVVTEGPSKVAVEAFCA